MRGDIEHNGVSLDGRAQAVAEELYREEVLTTSDVRDVISDSNSVANHRIDKLLEAGLIHVSRPEKPEDGPWPPKEIALTEAGMAFVAEHGLLSSSSGTPHERVDRVERRLSAIEERQETILQVIGAGDSRMPTVAQARAGFFAMNSYFGRNMDVEFEEEMPSAIRKEMEELTHALDGI